MSRLTDLIQQAKQGKRISEMLPIEPGQPRAIPIRGDDLDCDLSELDQLLPATPGLSGESCRLLCSELDDIAALLR